MYAHASAIVCARQDMHVRIARIHPQSNFFLLCVSQWTATGHLVSYRSQAVRDIMALGGVEIVIQYEAQPMDTRRQCHCVWKPRRAPLGVWSLALGVWSLELGVWSLEFGAWSLALGVWMEFAMLRGRVGGRGPWSRRGSGIALGAAAAEARGGGSRAP